MHGSSIVYAWFIYSICMVHLWYMHGSSIVYAWIILLWKSPSRKSWRNVISVLHTKCYSLIASQCQCHPSSNDFQITASQFLLKLQTELRSMNLYINLTPLFKIECVRPRTIPGTSILLYPSPNEVPLYHYTVSSHCIILLMSSHRIIPLYHSPYEFE